MSAAGTAGGFFITFEGPEGGGKSTQVHRLAARLADLGYAVWTTREPGGTRVGEAIRPLLLGKNAPVLTAWTEAFLFTAARAQLVEDVIRPRLARGEIVICDRFSDSTLAYQGYGRGLDLAALRRLQAEVTAGLQPALTLLLQLPVEAGLARIPSAAQDRLDGETVAFHERVSAGYRQMAADEPLRWREVDASAGPDQVAATVLEHVRRALAEARVEPAARRSA
ncbi:MAG: dTMP kinase [Candidatus Dormibacteraeota bacterium]|nr:dTMP kinase [Candidatus Dormibacteraeota bacterium]